METLATEAMTAAIVAAAIASAPAPVTPPPKSRGVDPLMAKDPRAGKSGNQMEVDGLTTFPSGPETPPPILRFQSAAFTAWHPPWMEKPTSGPVSGAGALPSIRQQQKALNAANGARNDGRPYSGGDDASSFFRWCPSMGEGSTRASCTGRTEGRPQLRSIKPFGGHGVLWL